MVAALLLMAAGPAHGPLLGEAGWTDARPSVQTDKTARSETLAHTLTHAPPECLAKPDAAGLRTQIEIGRALFRSPALLGGPAARLGLSCNACHRNGHANAQFFLPELTDRPGAADVTAEWASAVRGDGLMNPVTIPDLTGISTKKTFGHLHEPSLAAFVTHVIQEEFQGAAPPPQAFTGLMAYLHALDPAYCPNATEEALTLEDAAEEVRRPLLAAKSAEAATASLLLLAAQEALGRLAERLPETSFADERKSLVGLARELGALRAAGNPVPPGWMASFDALIATLRPREDKTYFNDATLRAALQARG